MKHLYENSDIIVVQKYNDEVVILVKTNIAIVVKHKPAKMVTIIPKGETPDDKTLKL